MGDVGALLGQVTQAVQILYGTNPASQQEANAWLTSFASSSEAWEVCLGLLVPGQAATEVQFYAANTLLKKIREQWGTLSPEIRSNVQGAVSERLQNLIAQPGGSPALVTSRLAMVVGVAAVLSGEDAAHSMVQQGLSLAATGANVPVAVELLTAVAEEADGLEREKRQRILAAVVPNAPEVLAMVEAIVTGRLDKSSAPAAARCLSAWLKLDAAGAGSLIMSAREMHSTQPGLLSALLAALGGEDEGMVLSCSDVLVELMASGLEAPGTEQHQGGGGGGGPPHAATSSIMAALLCHRGALAEDEGGHVGQALGRVAGAVAEYDSAAAVGAVAEAVPLAHLMMCCLGHSERRAVEAALDYFLMLNTVPLAERHADLQLPLYGTMLEPLLRHATIPSDLVDWGSYAGDDVDSFTQFREQILTDALDCCYGLLRGQYFAFMGQIMSGADTWQKAEACLFAIRCVALSVKTRVLSERKADLVNPVIQAEKAEATAFLVTTFNTVLSSIEHNGVFSSHLLVVEAACRMTGIYAAWFAGAKEAPLAGALRMLLRALAIPTAGGHTRHAASAIRNLCARCSSALVDPAALKGLLDTSESVVAGPSSHLALEDRQAVVEGVARLVSLLPPAEAQGAAVQLVAPLVRQAQGLVAAEEPPPGTSRGQAAEALAGELELIAAAVRFMEFAGDGLEGQPHPAMQVVEGVWPVLAGIASSSKWNWSTDVIAALCSVYQRCILALKAASATLLTPMASTLVALLDTGSHANCLTTLGTCAEVFGAVPDADELLGSALNAVVDRALRRLQGLGPAELAENAEFAAATLQLSDRYLLFAPGPLLGSSHLGAILGLAVRGLSMAEREPVQAALNFATHLSAPSPKQVSAPAWAAYGGHVSAAFSTHGEGLVRALLVSAAGSCPRHLLRVLAGCLFGLVTSPTYRGAVAGILPAVVMSPEYPAVKEGLLQEEDCKRFCSAALKQPPLERRRFDALVADFTSVCRAEGTGDALIAYEV